MGLLKKLKKLHKKTIGSKIISKGLKHDPLAKKLLKHDPLGKKIMGDLTGGRTDDVLKGGGKKQGPLARAMASRMAARSAAMGNTGIVPPGMGTVTASAPMMNAAPTGPAPILPPEMGGGIDPMYASSQPALPTGGPNQMAGAPMAASQPAIPAGPPGLEAGTAAPPVAPPVAPPGGVPMGRPGMMARMGRPSGAMMGGALARRRAMGGGWGGP